MSRRELEIIILALVGYICLFLGISLKDVNYQLFLFLMAGMFFLAIFRPKHSP